MEAEITSEMLNPEILCPPQLTPEQHVRLECLKLAHHNAKGDVIYYSAQGVVEQARTYTAFVLGKEAG